MSELSEVKDLAVIGLIGAGAFLLYRGVGVSAFGKEIFSIGGDGSPSPSPVPSPSPESDLPPAWYIAPGANPFWNSFLNGLNPANWWSLLGGAAK